MAEPRVLKLQSPAYGEAVYYKWPLVITKKHDEATEIVDTIRLVCEDFPELKYAVENVMLKDYEPTDYEQMNQLCQRYNKAIRNILSLWKGRAPPPRMYKPPSKELLRHIINLCYSHGIKEPEKLNLYEPFSPEVYGETSFDMVARILEEVQNNNKNECFVDLGSGVGQVVLQAAASNQFKECYGVEKAETPAMFAKEMEKQFKKWMDWFGKIYTDFTLEKGDFLEDKWKEIIDDCGVVFVNNFAFGPSVNHHLKSRFQTMKEGSRLISSREFCPTHFKFNKRNLSELGAMMRVSEIKLRSEESSVSWTGNAVSYYLHVVDRTRLEKYFSILQKRKHGQDLDEDEMSLYSESNYSVDTNGGVPLDVETLEDNLDDLYLGTTTRHQWQLLTETIKQSKQDAKNEKKEESKAPVCKKKPIQRPNKGKGSGKFELKNKILRKYGQQAMKKAMQASQDEESSINGSETESAESESEFEIKKDKKRGRKPIPKPEEVKKAPLPKIIQKEKKPVKIDINLEKDVDKFLAGMKEKYLEFINRMNSKQYADRLKVMIDCETAKKKLLQREINETERVVQNLISDGLKNFTNRLDELDVAVKTPLELLTKSTALAEKRKDLESKVINMEIEVYNLEEKHKNLCAARDQKNRQQGLEPLLESEDDDCLNASGSSKTQLTSKLCGAILSALNHRRSLIDKQSSLSEQISILEKISNPKEEEKDTSVETVDEVAKPKNDVPRPKPRPVAFVPPRMLSHDKKNTLSPETSVVRSHELSTQNQNVASIEVQRRPRGRPRKKPKAAGETSTQSDSSQDSKIELDERAPILTNQGRPPLNDINVVTNHQDGEQTNHHDVFTYHAQEERAPIIFPPKHSDVDGKLTKEFLKSSSKLLSSAATKWRPVEELWLPMSVDTIADRDEIHDLKYSHTAQAYPGRSDSKEDHDLKYLNIAQANPNRSGSCEDHEQLITQANFNRSGSGEDHDLKYSHISQANPNRSGSCADLLTAMLQQCPSDTKPILHQADDKIKTQRFEGLHKGDYNNAQVIHNKNSSEMIEHMKAKTSSSKHNIYDNLQFAYLRNVSRDDQNKDNVDPAPCQNAPYEKSLQIPSSSHEKSLQSLHNSHEKSLQIPPRSHEKSLQLSHNYHGKSLQIPPRSHEMPLQIPHNSHEKLLQIPQNSHEQLHSLHTIQPNAFFPNTLPNHGGNRSHVLSANSQPMMNAQQLVRENNEEMVFATQFSKVLQAQQLESKPRKRSRKKKHNHDSTVSPMKQEDMKIYQQDSLTKSRQDRHVTEDNPHNKRGEIKKSRQDRHVTEDNSHKKRGEINSASGVDAHFKTSLDKYRQSNLHVIEHQQNNASHQERTLSTLQQCNMATPVISSLNAHSSMSHPSLITGIMSQSSSNPGPGSMSQLLLNSSNMPQHSLNPDTISQSPSNSVNFNLGNMSQPSVKTSAISHHLLNTSISINPGSSMTPLNTGSSMSQPLSGNKIPSSVSYSAALQHAVSMANAKEIQQVINATHARNVTERNTQDESSPLHFILREAAKELHFPSRMLLDPKVLNMLSDKAVSESARSRLSNKADSESVRSRSPHRETVLKTKFDSTQKDPIRPLYCPNSMKLLKTELTSSMSTAVPASQIPLFQAAALYRSPTTSVSTAGNVLRSDPNRSIPSGLLLGQIAGMKHVPPTIPGGHPTYMPTSNPSHIPTSQHKKPSHPSIQPLIRPASSTYLPLTQTLLHNKNSPSPAKKARVRKKGEIHILPAATSTTDRHIVFAAQQEPPSVAIPFMHAQQVNHGVFKPQTVFSAPPPPVILSNSTVLNSTVRNVNSVIKPQVINFIQPHTSSASIGNIIIPKALPRPAAGSHAASQQRLPRPVASSPAARQQRFVLVPVSTIQDLNQTGSGIHERHQSMTSPTFPPPKH